MCCRIVNRCQFCTFKQIIWKRKVKENALVDDYNGGDLMRNLMMQERGKFEISADFSFY
jgi:hypothetical protein